MLHKFQHWRAACERQQRRLQLSATRGLQIFFIICIAFEPGQDAAPPLVQIVLFASCLFPVCALLVFCSCRERLRRVLSMTRNRHRHDH